MCKLNKYNCNLLGMFVLCLSIALGVSACIKGKVKVHDTKTGNSIVLEDDELEVYIQSIDAGRFQVETEMKTEAEIKTIKE